MLEAIMRYTPTSIKVLWILEELEHTQNVVCSSISYLLLCNRN